MALDLLPISVLRVEANSSGEEGNVSDLKDKTWLELCEAASREEDPERLLKLVTALNDLLEQLEFEEKAKQCACAIAWGAHGFTSSSAAIAP